MKTLIVGNGGRESSIAWRLASDSSVCAVMRHCNPTLAAVAKASGGSCLLADFTDPQVVAAYARENSIDLAVVSNDDALEAGVVDALLAIGIRTVGPTRSGAEIEWNKAFARRLLAKELPDATPRFWTANSIADLRDQFRLIERAGIEVVIKPQGLTSGKGVQVMGEHLKTLEDAEAYAARILIDRIGKSEEVVIEEKLDGVEFTIQAITDGISVVRVPATYDYPYRFEGDMGPGTGGMGSLIDSTLPLPFLTMAEYDECLDIIQTVLDQMRTLGRKFNGVLNAGFFLTKQGLKVMEFNARFGDPECMNVMMVLNNPLLEVLDSIERGTLDPGSVTFKRKASVVKYLVAPEYCLAEPTSHNFRLGVTEVEATGAKVFFASAEAAGAEFRSLGASRSVAIASLGDSIPEASDHVENCIQQYFSGPLEHRFDIGSVAEIEALRRRGIAARSAENDVLGARQRE